MKDILNKALVANADTDAVAKVIDAVVNTPRQDAQSDTAIERSLAVEEALAKRYKALRKAAIDIIADAVHGKTDYIKAADAIIKLVTAGRIIDIEDYIWSAKTVHKLDDDTDSVANADANCIVNVDAAGNGKDKSDRIMFRKDANGRIFELRGVNNDAPDELY
jgi:hypothetical protein